MSSPTGGIPVVGEGSDIDVSGSDIDLLNKETPPAPDRSKTEPEALSEEDLAKAEEERTEEVLGEEDEEKPSEEVEEPEEEKEKPSEDTTVDSAKFGEIKEAYPGIDKKFPWLRKAVFEHSHYQSVFPTVDAAKEAAVVRDIHQQLSSSVLEGRPEVLLNSMYEQDPAAVEKFAANFLPVLRKGSPQTYSKVVEPLIKNFLREVRAQGQKLGLKNVDLGVQHITNLLYNTPDLAPDAPPSEESTEVEQEKQKLAQEKEQFQLQKRVDFFNTCNSLSKSWLDKEIDRGLDPEKAMSNLVKEAATNYIKKEIHNTLINDKVHQSRMFSLYQEAEKANYTGDWAERIKLAYLGRVKPLLPGLRQKARQEALGESVKTGTRENTGERNTPKSRVVPSSGLPASSKGKIPDAKSLDWKKMSDDDFLRLSAEGKLPTK